MALLAAERARTEDRLAALRADFAGIVAASESSNADDEHDPEGATIAFERVAGGCADPGGRASARRGRGRGRAGPVRDVRRLLGVRGADRTRTAGGASDDADLRGPRRLTLGPLGRMVVCSHA